MQIAYVCPQSLSREYFNCDYHQFEIRADNDLNDSGARAHQSHEVATHSNILSVKFFAGSRRVISGHVHINGQLDYSKPARGSSAGAEKNVGGGESSSSSTQGATATNLTWRTNEQTKRAEWWDGTKWVGGDWSDEYQRWYAYYNGQWYYW
jgi:hypothetical protein